MKLFHLSDLHLGKVVHGYAMLEEQEHALNLVLTLADREQPQGLLIAGDVFDRSVAPAQALRLLDDFLVALSKRGIPAFIIAGNHDSPERLSFAASLMAPSGIHIAPQYDGQVHTHTLMDDLGPVDIHLLPFIRPAQVKKAFPEAVINTWTDAVRTALSSVRLDPERRHVLVAHQFVTGGQTSESEEFSVGGADNVDAAAFSGFDYVALGHLHRPQVMGAPHIRYAGSPLKYSFSEAGHSKSLTVVELGAKGDLAVRALPLPPLRDLVDLRGSYDQLASKAFYESVNRDNYVRITLTDEMDQPNAMQKLRLIYPLLMRLEYDNLRIRHQGSLEAIEDLAALSPLDLFARLYEAQNGQPLSGEQRDYVQGAISRVWEVAP